MSRIGRMPIAVPAGVTVDIAENNHVTVKGPKGTLERTLPSEMDIKLEGDEIIVTRPNDLKKMKSLHGLTRTLINNMVVGVTNGYTKELEVNGVGYRASKAGKVLTLNLGYSHPVEMEDPEGLESKVDGNKIIVSGIDKEKVGQGQKARSGAPRPGFEGGQMPLYRRLPKRGFKCINSKTIVGINVSALEVFDNDAVVSVETLLEKGIVKNPRDGVKILGNGELTKKLTVQANAFSASAKEKIEALGGKAEVI